MAFNFLLRLVVACGIQQSYSSAEQAWQSTSLFDQVIGLLPADAPIVSISNLVSNGSNFLKGTVLGDKALAETSWQNLNAKDAINATIFMLSMGKSEGANTTGTALSTFRYTAEGETFFHYGYAEDAGSFTNGLWPDTFATTRGDLGRFEAQSGLALPRELPPNAVYTITPAPGTLIRVNPIAEPMFDRQGGLPEINFPLGTGAGSVSGPKLLP